MSTSAYVALSIDAIARIAAGLALLYIVVPRMAFRAPAEAGALERFWWNFAVMTSLLVFAGQLLSFGNLYTLPSLLFVLIALVVIARWRMSGEPFRSFIRHRTHRAVLATFNILDERVNVRRRFRLASRRVLRRFRHTLLVEIGPAATIGWIAVALTAAVLRFYRPFSTLDLGASDPYVHLYWLKLLEVGKQVDVAWGPYPRGMHFILLAIVKLTNVDEVLLMNFFGAFIGVLLTLAVADVTRRIVGGVRAAIIAGCLFATMVGGAAQYWIVGGRFDAADIARIPHTTLSWFGAMFVFITQPLTAASFDLLFWTFKRQSVTLPQEMAVVLLFPTALFAMDHRRTGRTWYLAGYVAGIIAIAAIHPGVLVPLLVLVIAAWLARFIGGVSPAPRRLFPWTIAAILAGFSWAWIFTLARTGNDLLSYYGGQKDLRFFLPFLGQRPDQLGPSLYTSTTPVMMIVAAASFVLLIAAFALRRRAIAPRLAFIAIAALLFIVIQIASSLRLPFVLDPTRNSLWLAMTLAIVLGGVAHGVICAAERVMPAAVRALPAGFVLVAAAPFWIARVPDLHAADVRSNEFVDATEYGESAEALLTIERRLRPFTWTAVTYGQEFPHVLGRGYHMTAEEFLDRYDPRAAVLMIPTPYVFVVVEKAPHKHEVSAWADFTRANLQQRLQAWCVLYQSVHDDMRVYFDDDRVRVYVVQRSDAATRSVAAGLQRAPARPQAH